MEKSKSLNFIRAQSKWAVRPCCTFSDSGSFSHDRPPSKHFLRSKQNEGAKVPRAEIKAENWRWIIHRTRWPRSRSPSTQNPSNRVAVLISIRTFQKNNEVCFDVLCYAMLCISYIFLYRLCYHSVKSSRIRWICVRHVKLLNGNALTVSCRVALAMGKVGTQYGIVQHVQVCRHAVVAFVVVQHLPRQGEIGNPADQIRTWPLRHLSKKCTPAYLGRSPHGYLARHEWHFSPERCRDWFLDVSDSDASIPGRQKKRSKKPEWGKDALRPE